MSIIAIRRNHHLGMAKARALALKWAGHAKSRLSMECTIERAGNEDVVHFNRVGVSGELVVAADHVELKARLGLLFAAFKLTFEREIEKQLDELLVDGPGEAKEKGTPARKAAPAKTPATPARKASAPAKKPGAPAKKAGAAAKKTATGKK